MNNRTVEMPKTARKTKQTDDLKHEKRFPFSLGCFLLEISVSENLSVIRSGAAIPQTTGNPNLDQMKHTTETRSGHKSLWQHLLYCFCIARNMKPWNGEVEPPALVE